MIIGLALKYEGSCQEETREVTILCFIYRDIERHALSWLIYSEKGFKLDNSLAAMQLRRAAGSTVWCFMEQVLHIPSHMGGPAGSIKTLGYGWIG